MADKKKISNDPNFLRALFMLENQLDTPTDLYNYWRVVGSYKVNCPYIERVGGFWWETLQV